MRNPGAGSRASRNRQAAVALAVALTGLAFMGARWATPHADPVAWRSAKVEDGLLTADFPGAIEVKGVGAGHETSSTLRDGRSFHVIYGGVKAENGREPEKVLRGLETIVSKVATVTGRRPLRLAGFPGLEYRGTVPGSAMTRFRPSTLVLRGYVLEDHLVQV